MSHIKFHERETNCYLSTTLAPLDDQKKLPGYKPLTRAHLKLLKDHAEHFGVKEDGSVNNLHNVQAGNNVQCKLLL